MIYFTADCHLGHKRIIQYCNRPFTEVHEMNKTILDNINKVVKQDDTLYILGDFCFRGKKPLDYRLRINCRDVHLLLGNHDRRKDFYIDENTVDMNGFSSVQDVKEIIHCNQRIFLSHYSHRVWAASHKGSWHLFGHSHAKFDKEDRVSNRLTLDVGVDNTINYNKPFGQPWSFKELQKLFNEKVRNET